MWLLIIDDVEFERADRLFERCLEDIAGSMLTKLEDGDIPRVPLETFYRRDPSRSLMFPAYVKTLRNFVIPAALL